jgi:hypothetical protein
MTARFTVTVTDLPPEMGIDGSMVIDYTADDDATTEQIEAQVRLMLPQAALQAHVDGFDPDTATIDAVAVNLL